jgi:DNA-binding NarL/FixJ family response regulator
MTVCGEAENGAIAVEKVRELRPDIVILDLQMPVMNGLEAARAIAAVAPQTAMLMLTLHIHDQLSTEARAAGIREVLSKTDAIPQRLLASLKKVCA